ncbi:hypothetical protein CR513_16294, partial [Mucuna pruriens]
MHDFLVLEAHIYIRKEKPISEAEICAHSLTEGSYNYASFVCRSTPHYIYNRHLVTQYQSEFRTYQQQQQLSSIVLAIVSFSNQAKMTSAQQNFNAGQTQGQTQAKAEEWIQSTKESASAAADKAQEASNTSGQTAEQNKDEAAGFLQQTGEQVKNMAQGAVDSVKHTLGMDKNEK